MADSYLSGLADSVAGFVSSFLFYPNKLGVTFAGYEFGAAKLNVSPPSFEFFPSFYIALFVPKLLNEVGAS